MSYYDDDVPTVIRVLSFILPLVLLGVVAYNVTIASNTGSNLVTMIILLIVALAAAVCSLLIPGLKGYKKLVFSFVVCTMATVLALSGTILAGSKYIPKRSSGNSTSTTSIQVKDDLVDAPEGPTMTKIGYDQIVEYLTINEDTIRTLYEGKNVVLNKRAQINKESDSSGAALYVQRIKNDVTTLQNKYPTNYTWRYDDWDARSAWEEDPVKIYYYEEHGFIKAKEEYQDDSYYRVEKFSYIYYGNTGVIEKEEFRWIVSPSNNGGESLFDCQLRVIHSYS